MPKILAIGSPKGGVSKSTFSVILATVAARFLEQRVLLVDADDNRTAIDWTVRADDAVMPFDVAAGTDIGRLTQLRTYTRYDVIVIDLPGAREGAFRAILDGDQGQPVADFMLISSLAEVLDLRPVRRVIEHEIQPLELPYLLALTRVHSSSVNRALALAAEQRGRGIEVAGTIVRNFSAYNIAVEQNRTIFDLPGGPSSPARKAEADCRSLAFEILGGGLHLDTRKLEVQ